MSTALDRPEGMRACVFVESLPSTWHSPRGREGRGLQVDC